MVSYDYIFDPLCGWCFGASPLIEVLVEHCHQHQIKLNFHPAGMFTRQALPTAYRAHIIAADQRIAMLTGQEFGASYLARLQADKPIIMDSQLTCQAIIAAPQLGLNAELMLHAIQRGHYQLGLDVSDNNTLASLAAQLGVNAADWQHAMANARNILPEALTTTKALMSRHLLQGYPSLLQTKHQQSQAVALSTFYGAPEAWRAWLEAELS
ncbi:DsbA family protein [Pseudoalteromonas fenneropenaei]|uniref:DsbA family protein n=1 Tax=Pseudoalteromonas fenneropenaei TaxID=1737459 RepID=A0ABV7CGG3_9GAMM